MSTLHSTLTYDRLKELLHYDPDTGVFKWASNAGRWGRIKSGTIAGCLSKDGYRLIRLDGVLYKAHQLAWLYVHGEFAGCEIDHRYRQRDDNRISELRKSNRQENMQNQRRAHPGNTSGYLGVSWNACSGKWMAQIKIPEKKNNLYLGLFDDPLKAHNAYLEAKRQMHQGCTI